MDIKNKMWKKANWMPTTDSYTLTWEDYGPGPVTDSDKPKLYRYNADGHLDMAFLDAVNIVYIKCYDVQSSSWINASSSERPYKQIKYIAFTTGSQNACYICNSYEQLQLIPSYSDTNILIVEVDINVDNIDSYLDSSGSLQIPVGSWSDSGNYAFYGYGFKLVHRVNNIDRMYLTGVSGTSVPNYLGKATIPTTIYLKPAGEAPLTIEQRVEILESEVSSLSKQVQTLQTNFYDTIAGFSKFYISR